MGDDQRDEVHVETHGDGTDVNVGGEPGEGGQPPQEDPQPEQGGEEPEQGE